MIGNLLSNRYRLEAKLGSGGMSTVYLAIDETLGRRVAVKLLHREISDQPDQLERFRREARAVAQLSHPNLVGVIDAGDDDGRPYIVFEYVPGETLKKRIEDFGPLHLDEAAAYTIEIGRGLASAHAARLVHRDVKPQNVLIDADGRAKITDFGIARSLEAHGLTATGRVLGTTDYVSPEQAMGREVDPRTDVYSLGIVLYEMLTGEVPFQAETQVGVAMKHVNEEVPNVQLDRPDASAALAAAVEVATAKEPEHRYPDMDAFVRDLEGALEVEVSRAGGSGGEATTVLDSLPEKRRRFPSRRRISVVGVVALVLAAAAAIAIAALSGSGGSEDPDPTTDTAPASPIALAAAKDFDPLSSNGDGSENPEQVTFAIDGDNSSSWSTDTYYDGLEALKDGVGLVLDAGEKVTPTELELKTDGSGWGYEVYAASGSEPPPDLADWGSPIAADLLADSKNQTVELSATEAHRYFLIWVTSLDVPDDGSGAGAEIFEAQLLG